MGLEGKRLRPRPLPAQGVYAGCEVPELPVGLAQSLHLEEEAQVQGLALWGDLRLAAVGASFTTAFVRIGLVPDSGLSFLLPRLVGLAKAQELLLLSPRLSAEEALALGLVHRVVPAEKLMEEALSLAKELAQGPTRAYALTKKLLLETYRLSLTEALALEAVLQGQAGQTQDHEEGVRAFREKRPPRFQGR